MPAISDIYAECCSEHFPLPTEEEIASLEQELQISFPQKYRDYLKKYNGGVFRKELRSPMPRKAIVVFPEPPTVEWRDGLVTHVDNDLNMLYGFHATFDVAKLGDPSSVNIFDDNDPLQLLPIGDTGMGSFLLIDFDPNCFGYIRIKFPDEKAYIIANNIEQFFELIEVRDEA